MVAQTWECMHLPLQAHTLWPCYSYSMTASTENATMMNTSKLSVGKRTSYRAYGSQIYLAVIKGHTTEKHMLHYIKVVQNTGAYNAVRVRA